MGNRPMCSCGSPVRQKGQRNGEPLWRSKCSRCETRAVDTMVSTDLIEEMQASQVLRTQLQALRVNLEILKGRDKERESLISEITSEKARLTSALDEERRKRAMIEADLSTQAVWKHGREIKLRELKEEIELRKLMMKKSDEEIKSQDDKIKILRSDMAKRDEVIEELEQTVKNAVRESQAHLVTLTQERSAWTESIQRMHELMESSRQSVALAGHTIETERDQVESLLHEARKSALKLQIVALGWMATVLIWGVQVWVSW